MCRTTLSWRHSIGMLGKTHQFQCKQCKQSNCLMFVHSYYVSRIHGHIIIPKGIFSIFPLTVRSTFPKEALLDDYIVALNVIELYVTCHLWMNGNKYVMSCTKCSLRVLYNFFQLNSTHVFCLRLVFYWNVR